MKAKVATVSLKGKDDIWWDDLKNVKGIREEELFWSEFKGHFRRKYLLERYFYNNTKELMSSEWGK